MKFFGKGKEAASKEDAAAAAPTTTLPTISVTPDDKKEPLIGKSEDFEESAVILPPSVKNAKDAEAPEVKSDSTGAPGDSAAAESTVPSPSYDKPIADQEPGNEDDNTLWIKTKIPNIRSKTLWKSVGAKFRNLGAIVVALPLWAKIAAGVGVVVAFLAVRGLMNMLSYHKNINVAFVGSAYLFVNDVPRLVEAMGNGHISQDSCLHGSGSLLNILKYGNGMFYRWQTGAAQITNPGFVNQWGNLDNLYDYGACSVPQLLTGKDDNLAYFDQNGIYYNDGTNPCFQDTAYFDYRTHANFSDPKWDYVVLSDQSKRMSFDDTRDEAIMAMKHTYRPFFKHSKAIPIIVQPHAFWSESLNMTDVGNVETFTSKIYEGAEYYRKFLAQQLGLGQRPRIAPVGNAFLAVKEANYDLWVKLFLDDYIHPSAYGSLLYAYVIYATMYKHMPRRSDVVLDDVSELFSNVRALHSSGYGNSTFPTKNEAGFLFDIAFKVGVRHAKPTNFKETNIASDYEDQEDQDEDVDEEEQYDYDYDDEDEKYEGNYDYNYNAYDQGEDENDQANYYNNNGNNNNNNNNGAYNYNG